MCFVWFRSRMVSSYDSRDVTEKCCLYQFYSLTTFLLYFVWLYNSDHACLDMFCVLWCDTSLSSKTANHLKRKTSFSWLAIMADSFRCIPVSARPFFLRFAYITARSSRQEFCTHFHLRERSRDVRDKIVTRYIYSFALFDAMFQFSVFTKGDGILSRVDGEQTKTRRDFGSNSAHSAQLLWRYMRISLRAQTRRASWTGLFECGE